MAISNLNKTRFAEIIREFVRPSEPIDSFEHLVGRTKQRDGIEEAINSGGRHIFIYGDRGAGKTSLAQTIAFEHNPANHSPVLVACGSKTTFGSIVKEIATQLSGRSRLLATETSVGGTASALGVGLNSAMKSTERSLEALDLNMATGLILESAMHRLGRSIVVIDEFENLPSLEDRALFAELAKQLSDRRVPVTLVFCGIGKSLEDLLQGHGSAHRYLYEAQLPTPPLNFGGCWQILDSAADALSVTVNEDSRLRIAQVSDGFPHYVHLICEKLFWLAFRREEIISTLTPEHYMEAVTDALHGVEARLRNAYEKAVMKQRDEFQEVLWSVADHFELERNIHSVYANSYERIMTELGRKPVLEIEFARRLSALKSKAHGNMLTSSRRGWVKFSENLIRGYVRLVAGANGVRLALEHEPGPDPKVLTVGHKRESRRITVFPRPHYTWSPPSKK